MKQYFTHYSKHKYSKKTSFILLNLSIYYRLFAIGNAFRLTIVSKYLFSILNYGGLMSINLMILFCF